MQSIIGVLFQIFALIVLGFLLKKKSFIDDHFEKKLNLFVVKIVLPFSILISSNNEFNSELSKSVFAMAILSFSYYAFTMIYGYLTGKVFYKDNNAAVKVFTNCTVFANTIFLGLPLIGSIFGKTGVLLAIIYNLMYNLFFYSFGIAFYQNQKKFDKVVLLAMLKDPAIIASIVTIIIYLSPFRLPPVGYDFIQLVANLMTPLSMILLGASLTKINLQDMVKHTRLLFISFSRLAILPALMYGISFLFPTYKFVFQVAIILTALPVGSLNNVIAQRYDNHVSITTISIVQSMLLMLITLPIWLMIVGT